MGIPRTSDHKRPGRGRPVNRTTKLGRMIDERALPVYIVTGKTGIAPRTMVEYTNGRRIITPDHIKALCEVLDCKPEDIVEPKLTKNLTDVTGRPLDPAIKSALDLDMSHLDPKPDKTRQPLAPHTSNVAPERLIRKAV